MEGLRAEQSQIPAQVSSSGAVWAHRALAGAYTEQELLWVVEGLHADVIPVSDLEKGDTQ